MEKGFGNPRSITEAAREPDLSYHITSAGFLLPSLPPDEAPRALYNFRGHYFILYNIVVYGGHQQTFWIGILGFAGHESCKNYSTLLLQCKCSIENR